VIDLVGNDAHTVRAAPFDEVQNLPVRQHRSRGIGRARNDKSILGDRHSGQQFHGRLKPMGTVGDERHRLDIERGKDIPVARISWGSKSNPIPRVKGTEERQYKRAGRARRDGDTSGVDLDVIARTIVVGDGPA